MTCTSQYGVRIQSPLGEDEWHTWIHPEADGVTVTRRAPQPQAGEVWEGVRRPAAGVQEYTVWIGGGGSEWATDAGEGTWPVDVLDFTGARCVYPPPDQDATEAGAR